MSISELARAGIVDTRDRRGLLDRLYQVYTWIVVVLVLVLPTKPDQTAFYFPAIVGPAAA